MGGDCAALYANQENRITFVARNSIALKFGRWIWQRQWRDWIHVTCWAKKKEEISRTWLCEKKSHLLLSHKRMNRYQFDVGLCKHKKIVGGDYSVFLAYDARNLNKLGLNSRVKWEKLTSVCDYFHSPLFFLTPSLNWNTEREWYP